MNRSVAIVGSGPGGIYVAQALAKKLPGCRLDIIDRLPTPFGLIRGGVAPDHQKTKNVDKKYAETANGEGVRFIGNIAFGRDVSLAELQEIYDAVVLAYGAPFDNRLGIAGEDKANVIGSNAFVGWYNCHPDFRGLDPDLNTETAVVIGIGNVAIDVARILAKTPHEMAATDIADYALERIDGSPLRDIHMFGRRGPVEAAFTLVELRELAELEACGVDIDQLQLPKAPPDTLDARAQRVKGRILDALWGLSDHETADMRRSMHIRFFAMPVEILGGERVEGIRMEHTRVENGRCTGTGETFDVPCGLVVTCIGSRAEQIEGVPFDEKRNIVLNRDGRVAPGVYAAGWAKRGAVGTIGTNRLDSFAVADLIIEDFTADAKPGPDALDRLIVRRKLRPVSFDDWLVINRLEERAAAPGAPRRKFSTVKEMLSSLAAAKADGRS